VNKVISQQADAQFNFPKYYPQCLPLYLHISQHFSAVFSLNMSNYASNSTSLPISLDAEISALFRSFLMHLVQIKAQIEIMKAMMDWGKMCDQCKKYGSVETSKV